MKKFSLIISIMLFLSLFIFCTGIATAEDAKEIAVFSSRGDSTELTPEQITAREDVGNYMDRYLIQGLNKKKYSAVLLNNKEDKSKTAHLLEVTITDLKEVSRTKRFWGGMMAGANTLYLHYDFFDPMGKNILSWDDSIGSTKSSRRCAQALNKKAIVKISDYLK
jgi:hypothetical protein